MLNKFLIHISKGFLLSLLFSFGCLAQSSEIEMADTLRSNGKIYVVLLTVLIVLIGLFLFLLYLDRKISNLEK